MSNAERQKKYRESRKAEGKRYKWVKKPKIRMDAGYIARQRFEALISEKLKDCWDDTIIWEFYTFLYKKTKEHRLDHSGYESFDYQADREMAKKLWDDLS